MGTINWNCVLFVQDADRRVLGLTIIYRYCENLNLNFIDKIWSRLLRLGNRKKPTSRNIRDKSIANARLEKPTIVANHVIFNMVTRLLKSDFIAIKWTSQPASPMTTRERHGNKAHYAATNTIQGIESNPLNVSHVVTRARKPCMIFRRARDARILPNGNVVIVLPAMSKLVSGRNE